MTHALSPESLINQEASFERSINEHQLGPCQGARRFRKRFDWSDVLRVISTTKARERALRLYREAGFTPDQFGHVRSAREALSDALTRTEDWLELEGGHVRVRAAIRDVRRRLELELWP